MESLSYASEGRRLLVSDDMDLHVDEVRKPLHGEQICCPIKDSIENIGFTGHDLPDFHRNSVLGDETNNHFGNSVLCNSTITFNSLVEPSPRFSSSVASGKRCTVDNSVLTSPEPSVSAKRARASNLQSQNPCCQVYGCGKDLSSSKDYHKRHKVCDAHSKASVVIVNGIQQRFCQQCSRFHLLSEFDEGKRSCRKRLAGHNERRRKPQFDAHLGSTFLRPDFSPKASFFLSKFLPGGLFNPQGNEPTNCIKFEEEPSQVSQLASKFGQSLPKSLLHLRGIGKKYPSKNCLNAPLPSVQDLPVSPSSNCALSLLSAQSHDLLSHSAGMSMVPSLISKQNYHSNPFTDQNSSKSFASNIFYSSDGVEQEGIPLILDDCASVGLEIPGDGLSRESNSLNLKNYVSPESANTVNLMELSLHLQRVEQQKHYAHVKLENGEVYPPTSTS